MAHGGVAPVASTPAALSRAMGALGGVEEQFAFKRAISRLYEMQSPQYIMAAARLRGHGAALKGGHPATATAVAGAVAARG